jgi:hypothetical protein
MAAQPPEKRRPQRKCLCPWPLAPLWHMALLWDMATLGQMTTTVNSRHDVETSGMCLGESLEALRALGGAARGDDGPSQPEELRTELQAQATGGSVVVNIGGQDTFSGSESRGSRNA